MTNWWKWEKSPECEIKNLQLIIWASSQYGGQSFSLAHLIPFVEVSRQKIRKQVIEERTECGDSLDTEIIERVVAKRLKEEITRGIQTIQYQLITLQTTNGFSYYEKRRAVLKFREPIVIGCYKSESSYS